ncbi:MAG: DUF1573 domain-containing protein, partial [Candidatus Nomurabacteria bacterium]|nr:DUF1573 domain-containing protein [Candidatus Nomurabacteria bacterium]
MKKLITLTIIAIAIILVIFLIAKPKTASIEQISETNNSIITVDRDMHDFGDIDIFSGKVSTEFTVTNTGDQETIILSAITSCGCTEGEINGMNFGMHSGLDSPVVIPAG